MPRPVAALKAIVLDFDGVVLETDFPWMRAWQSVLATHGLRLEATDWLAFVGADESVDPRQLLYRRGIVLSTDEAESVMTYAVQAATEMITKARPRLGVIRLLQQAQGCNIPVAVATNGSREWLNKWLPADLDRYITVTVTADDVARPKPAPDIHRLALIRLGLDPTADARFCVGVEDSAIGAAAVLAAGLGCVYAPTRLNRYAAAPSGVVRAASMRHLSVDSLESLVSGTGLQSL